MDDEWISKDVIIIKQLYCTYWNTEPALISYLYSVAKLLNELINIKDETLLKYEKQILWRPLKIFCKFFLDQVGCAAKENDPIKKNRIIMDIEEAVTKVVTAYKNLVDFISNSDGLIITNFSVDTNVLDLSPKLTAFYSSIFDSITELFDQKAEKYAFFLYPNLRAKAQVHHLFNERKGLDRIVIVYIPEYTMGNVKDVLVLLIHEAFHVLTQDERNRRLRAGIMLQLMEKALVSILFDNTELDTSVIANLEVIWFNAIDTELDKYTKLSPDDSFFYGKNIMEKQFYLICNLLEEISIRDRKLDIIEELNKSSLDFPSNYAIIYEIAVQADQLIHSKLFWILTNHIVEKLLRFFMFLFREIYADIALLLFVPITPEQYTSAFLDSIPFNFEDDFFDMECSIRIYIVSLVISAFKDIDEAAKWNKLNFQIRQKSLKNANSEAGCEYSFEYKDKYFSFSFSKVMEKLFMEYFQKCALELSNKFSSLKDCEPFRDLLNTFFEMDNDQVLTEVFSGEIFDYMIKVKEEEVYE